MKKNKITVLLAVGMLTAGVQAQQVLLLGQTVFENVDTTNGGGWTASAVVDTPNNYVTYEINQSSYTNAIGQKPDVPGFSCNDVHYGPDTNAVNATGEGAVLANAYRINGEYVEWTLINNSGSNIELQAIRFDAMCRWKGSFPDIDVYYMDGDLPFSKTKVLATVTVEQRADNNDVPQNMTDYEVDLTTLIPVTVLEDGQSATFALVGSAGNGSVIDNVGFFGEVGVPLPANYPPVFSTDPITVITGVVDTALSGSLTNFVSDRDGDAITYAISGASWLNVDPVSGALSGTPVSTNAGWNTFVVSASDGSYSMEAALIVPVLNPADEALDLVGWTGKFSRSADVKDLGGLKATILDYSKKNLKMPSTDNTWGDILMTPFPDEMDYAYAAVNDVTYKFSVTNESPWDIQLADVLFDYARFANGPTNISISASLNGTVSNALGTVIGAPKAVSGHQFAFSNAWADTTLLRGDWVVVQMTFTDGAASNVDGYIDNIAVRYEKLGFSDRDSDGIPDFWEENTWTNGIYQPDATSDYDNDGFIDKDEYYANTDPMDSESLLQMESILPASDGDVEISWQSASNRTYRLLTKSSIAAGSWMTTEHTNIISTPPSNTITLTNAPSSAFFRVEVEME